MRSGTATFYLNVLEQKQKALNAGYILNGESRPTTPSPCPGRLLRPAGLPLRTRGRSLSSQEALGPQGREQPRAEPPPVLRTCRALLAVSKPCPASIRSAVMLQRRVSVKVGASGSLAGFLRVLQP